MCSKKPRYWITKAGKCPGTKPDQKGVSLLPKVTRVLLSSQTLAENTLAGQSNFFIQTHPSWAAYCFSSATVPNVTESNDFLIMMWQQNGPQRGWWRSCNWYSACPLSSQACFGAGRTKATYNEILPLPAAAFAWSQLCLRARDITLLVTRTEFHRKSPPNLVIFTLWQHKTTPVDHKHKRYLLLFPMDAMNPNLKSGK